MYLKLYYTCSNVFKVIFYLLYLKTFFGLFRAVALSSSLHTALSLSTLFSISLHQGTDMCQLSIAVKTQTFFYLTLCFWAKRKSYLLTYCVL
jgi:hypothetical protein